MNYCPISLLFNGPIYWEEVTVAKMVNRITEESVLKAMVSIGRYSLLGIIEHNST